jgi:hypothetical protein
MNKELRGRCYMNNYMYWDKIKKQLKYKEELCN